MPVLRPGRDTATLGEARIIDSDATASEHAPQENGTRCIRRCYVNMALSTSGPTFRFGHCHEKAKGRVL